MILGDCVDKVAELESDSIDFSIFSPPFSDLYTYSNSDRDMPDTSWITGKSKASKKTLLITAYMKPDETEEVEHVDENEQEYLKSGEIKRYTVMLGPPAMGHIFILGNDYIYNTPIGSIFKWKNYKEWHAGTNAGLTPNYMFHILGS
jgi:hypothetical protein